MLQPPKLNPTCGCPAVANTVVHVQATIRFPHFPLTFRSASGSGTDSDLDVEDSLSNSLGRGGGRRNEEMGLLSKQERTSKWKGTREARGRYARSKAERREIKER
jgi:hypothetical protein